MLIFVWTRSFGSRRYTKNGYKEKVTFTTSVIGEPLDTLLEKCNESYKNIKDTAEVYLVLGGQENGSKIAKSYLELMVLSASIIYCLARNNIILEDSKEQQ